MGRFFFGGGRPVSSRANDEWHDLGEDVDRGQEDEGRGGRRAVEEGNEEVEE